MAVDTLTTPRSLADIQWARRLAATAVQEAAARVRVEHGRVVDIYDLSEAVYAYLAGEAAGWPGRRPEGVPPHSHPPGYDHEADTMATGHVHPPVAR